MPKYIFTYHSPTTNAPAPSDDSMAAWQSFLGGIGEQLVDMGAPTIDRTSVGEVGAATQLGGYSIVAAATLEEAATLANGAPTLQYGGGVEVSELGEM